MFVNFRLSTVSRRARCAARRRGHRICAFCCCWPSGLKRKIWNRIDGNVEPKRAISNPFSSNKDVRLRPVLLL